VRVHGGEVLELIRGNVYGPVTRYSDSHIFVALDLMNGEGRVSRKALAERTGLGAGSVKGMLNVLKDWKWIEINQSGVALTEFGRRNFLGFGIRFVDIRDDTYAVGLYQQGAVVEGVASAVTNGMAQRDDAVRNGAIGASVFVMRDGRVVLPEIWDMDEKDPGFAGRVRAAGMKDGDALVLVGADSPEAARVAAAAVGLGMR